MGGWLSRLRPSWLFPTEADRIERARRRLSRGDPAEARLELEGLESDEATALLAEAEHRLVEMNLERARGEIQAGELEDAEQRLELADRFAAAGHRRAVREVRRELRRARADRRAAEAPRTPQVSSDPFGGGGGGLVQGGPEVPVEEPSPGFGADPVFSLPPDDPRVRYALLLEAYPEEVRARSQALGAGYAEAVLLLEQGSAERAMEALTPFVDRDPVARYERARAALSSGDPGRAATDLRIFGEELGHQRIGQNHTGVLLARVLASLGRTEEGLALVESLRSEQPGDLELAAVHVSLLASAGDLAGADARGVELLRKVPRDMGLVRLLARIRLQGGKRREAAEVLEAGLAKVCTTPGKCGSQPLDVEAARMLAQIYLEDREQPRRVEQLFEEIAQAGPKPAWIDGYLHALRARNRGEPGAVDQARALLAELPPEDPRRALLNRHFDLSPPTDA